MPITKATASSIAPAAKGDLVVGSATNDASVLAVGSANQVLTVDSSTSTGLKWAAPAGALTKISSTTFTNVSTQDIDSLFSSTYDTYLVSISQVYAGTAGDDLHLQMRYSTTTQATQYYGCLTTVNNFGTEAHTSANNAGECLLANACGVSSYPTSLQFYVNFPSGGGAGGRIYLYGVGYDAQSSQVITFGYENATAQTYTGFRLKSSSSNITGKVVVYGLEK